MSQKTLRDFMDEGVGIVRLEDLPTRQQRYLLNRVNPYDPETEGTKYQDFNSGFTQGANGLDREITNSVEHKDGFTTGVDWYNRINVNSPLHNL